MKTKKFLLEEKDIPTAWYNIVADMKNKPMPMLNPKTKQPLKEEDLYPLFSKGASQQEMNTTDAWIEIPEEVRDMYKVWRPTPLVRAYGLEKALDTPAHIYFKNESVSPIGSHKLNSALAQAYYCKQEGVTNITTETGAGQWGAALSYAAKAFGLELAVYMVKVSYHQKPYRRSIMQTFGAQVIASPSMSTLIGLEAEKQMEMAGEYPDVVIGCFGGGSNFSGISFPFFRHKIKDGKDIRIVAAEPASCPKLTRGEFHYDYGDEAGYTPLIPMFTLGHNFAPANIHAGGLRYHGAGSIVSQLMKDGLMEAVDVQQLETFKAATLFAQSEGIIPAPESAHAIATAIREAEQAKLEGKPRTILFNLSGHGLIDMAAYDMYIAGDLTNYNVSDEELKKNFAEIEKL